MTIDVKDLAPVLSAISVVVVFLLGAYINRRLTASKVDEQDAATTNSLSDSIVALSTELDRERTHRIEQVAIIDRLLDERAKFRAQIRRYETAVKFAIASLRQYAPQDLIADLVTRLETIVRGDSGELDLKEKP